MEFIIEVSQRIDIRTSQVPAQILAGYKNQIGELLRIFKLGQSRCSKLFSLGRADFFAGCGNGLILPFGPAL